MKLKLLPKPPLLNSWNCIRFAKGPCGPFCILVTGARLDLATVAHPSRTILMCVWKEWRCNVWRYLIRSLLREEVRRLGWLKAKPPLGQMSGGVRDDDCRRRSDATALHSGRKVGVGKERLRGGQVATTSNSIPNLTGAVRAGLGVGLLPQMVGRATPGLVLCFPPPVETDSHWWLVASPEAYQQPRVRSFMAFAAALIRQDKSGGLRT